jgi:hypothetical protein
MWKSNLIRVEEKGGALEQLQTALKGVAGTAYGGNFALGIADDVRC